MGSYSDEVFGELIPVQAPIGRPDPVQRPGDSAPRSRQFAPSRPLEAIPGGMPADSTPEIDSWLAIRRKHELPFADLEPLVDDLRSVQRSGQPLRPLPPGLLEDLRAHGQRYPYNPQAPSGPELPRPQASPQRQAVPNSAQGVAPIQTQPDAQPRAMPQQATPAAPSGSYADEVLGDPVRPAAGRKPKNAELVDDPNRTLGFVDQAKGSFAATDDQWKFNAARALYPDEPPAKAMQRFGVTAEGRAFHRGDDGKLYEVQPASGWRRLANVGEGVGPSLPAVAGGALGLGALPTTGGVGSVGAAMIGGYAGETARQYIGNQLLGGPEGYSYGNALKESAVAGLGQGLGLGINRLAGRFAAPDIADFNPQATRDLLDKAQRAGIRLTPAEATGMQSLIGEQKRLQSSPSASNTMTRFAEERGREVTGAWDRFLGRVGQPRDAGELGRQASGLATDIVTDAQTARTAAVEPFYRAAEQQIGSVNPGNIVQFVAQQLPTAKGSERNALRFVQSQLQRVGADGAADGTVDMSFRGLNGAKQAIDALLQNEDLAMKQGIDRTAHATLERARNMIVQAIEASPGAAGAGGTPGPYAAGRATYGAITEQVVQPMQEILAPLLRANPANSSIVRAAQSMLDPQTRTPQLVAQARGLIEPRNPEVWQAMVRQFLHEHAYSALQENAKGFVSNAGGNIAKRVGNDKMEATLRVALPRGQFREYLDLIDVFRATGRAVDTNSDTAFKTAAVELGKERARGPLGRILANINPAQALRNYSDAMANRNYERQAQQIAEIFARGDQGAIQALRQLRQTSPNDIRRRLVIGHLLGNAADYGASEATDAIMR